MPKISIRPRMEILFLLVLPVCGRMEIIMKKIQVLLCLACAAVLLTACGKKDKTDIDSAVENPTAAANITPAPSSMPKISEKYNSIEDANKKETSAVREELLSVANSCKDIYEQADKGSTFNVVLDEATVQSMVTRIGQQGYSAVDYLGTMNMQCPDPIVYFGSTIASGEDTGVSYYMVYNDGQISVYHIARTNGIWYLIAMSAVWDDNDEPKILTEGRYAVGDVQYTDKGWLIYNRDTASFDDNQRANTNSYTFVRVLPYDSTKRALAQKYVEPIGYFENNLFTTTWTEANLGVIDFNSLYAYLFGMYHGTASLTTANSADYFSAVSGTKLRLVPTSSFENVVQYYFNIDSATLKNISDYSSRLGGYFFLPSSEDLYNSSPRTPVPEVVDYWYNADGTLTLRVDALNQWYGTDKAFSHELTVRENAGGGFSYVANTLITDENSIIPGRQLSTQLDIERAKTDY